MKVMILIIVLAALLSLVGCKERAPENMADAIPSRAKHVKDLGNGVIKYELDGDCKHAHWSAVDGLIVKDCE